MHTFLVRAACVAVVTFAAAIAGADSFPLVEILRLPGNGPVWPQLEPSLLPPLKTLLPISAPDNPEGTLIPPHERLPVSSDARVLVAGNNQFAIDLFKRIGSGEQANRNMLASPLSISAALAMTYAGARGLTAEQMADALHFTLPDDRLHSAFAEVTSDLNAVRPGYHLSIANRLFGQHDLRYKQEFLDVVGQNYDAPLERMDFVNAPESARMRINDWVEEQTHDKIKDLLPQGIITPQSRLVLTNAIYFDGKWKYKFDEDSTHDAPFFTSDGAPTPTATMFQNQQFRYGDFESYKMLEMQYAGDDLSMVLMLPDEHDGLQALESSLSAEQLNEDLAAMTERDVNVWLPKFKFEASFQLKDPLIKMGMTEAFQNGGLTGMAEGDFMISDVLHKAFIDVNEAGTEAAAATAVIIMPTRACMCHPPQPEEFRADHPFLFALRDRHSGSLMFMGRVAEPGEAIIASLASPNVPEPASLALFLVGLAFVSCVRSARANAESWRQNDSVSQNST